MFLTGENGADVYSESNLLSLLFSSLGLRRLVVKQNMNIFIKARKLKY